MNPLGREPQAGHPVSSALPTAAVLASRPYICADPEAEWIDMLRVELSPRRGDASGEGMDPAGPSGSTTTQAPRTCKNCGDTGLYYEPYLQEWAPCRVCRPDEWEAWRK